jgi:hypothetical protein
MVSWAEMPRSPGHVFYDRLQDVLIAGGFDLFVETACQPYYAPKMGGPSATASAANDLVSRRIYAVPGICDRAQRGGLIGIFGMAWGARATGKAIWC